MRRLWGLLKAWHATALNEHMAKHRTQYGSGAATTRRPT
jgi:hypothetical protein